MASKEFGPRCSGTPAGHKAASASTKGDKRSKPTAVTKKAPYPSGQRPGGKKK